MSPEPLTDRNREERAAITEAAFRIANERMFAWEERHADGAPEYYLCECAVGECREKIALTRVEYESVRADSHHFSVVPGHEIPDLETVVRSESHFNVVEKPQALHHLVVETDPREPGTGDDSRAAEEVAAGLDDD